MCFGRRSSSVYTSSSSSSDEFHARPIELDTISLSARGTSRATASMPSQALRTADRETIRVVEPAGATNASQQRMFCRLRTRRALLTIALSKEVNVTFFPTTNSLSLSRQQECVFLCAAMVASFLVSPSTSSCWPSPSGARSLANPSPYGSPLLIAFLLAFVFVVTITFGHLRYEPARRGSTSYIVPLNDEEIELYHIGSSPLSTVDEDPTEEEMYRRHLAERPLPPEPTRRRRRSGRGSPFPTLISPLSDPFIEQDTRVPAPAQGGRNTIRLVPESSRKSDLV
ncbi:unnamed protein product, partial [Aureobasidium mustum]